MLTASAKTDIGQKRSVNQDEIFVSTGPVGPLSNLFIVADGMGGHSGGEIASQLAVKCFVDYVAAADTGDTLDLMTDAARAANLKVLDCAETTPGLSGMGTTLTACSIIDGKCRVVHVGDSRCYVGTDDGLTQITQDHSYVNAMLKAGHITEAEVSTHPQRNVLTRVLGVDAPVELDGCLCDVTPGDYIVLCSDGLYTMLSDTEIHAAITPNLTQAVDTLISAANANGGDDNISVIIISTTNTNGVAS